MRLLMCAAVMLGAIGVRGALAQDNPAPAATQPQGNPVDYRDLKQVMPEKLAGLPRGEVQGENLDMGGIKMSHASAPYGGSTDAQDANAPPVPSAQFDIADYSFAPEMGAGLAARAQMPDTLQESDAGVVQTTKIGEHPMFLNYDNAGQHAEVQLYVAGRFIVNLQTDGLTLDQVRAALQELPLKAISELKPR
jgi:hypothetical protein